MAKPLDSVVALSHFLLTEEQQAVAAQLLAAESNWPLWLRQIELHALSGFAALHIQQYKLPVPAATVLRLRALTLRHRLAAEARYSALQQIDAAFADHDIPYLGLKGVCLMPMIYRQPDLRPMRDMDLLIPIEKEREAAQCMRDLGFSMPDVQPSKYMKNMHQLPDATKKVNGFKISVELHRDGYNRDTPGALPYPSAADKRQQIAWQDLQLSAFEDLIMLDQVCRHLASMHPNQLLKLINVMDVVGLAQRIEKTSHWPRLERDYPNIINALRCIHCYTPLPQELQAAVGKMPLRVPSGVGQMMVSLRSIVGAKNMPFLQRCQRLFSPSDWWLHLVYNVHPDKTLFWVKTVRHPMRILAWIFNRAYSRILGG